MVTAAIILTSYQSASRKEQIRERERVGVPFALPLRLLPRTPILPGFHLVPSSSFHCEGIGDCLCDRHGSHFHLGGPFPPGTWCARSDQHVGEGIY